MTVSEYSRPNRLPLNQTTSPISNSPVRVSFLSVPLKAVHSPSDKEDNLDEMANGTSAYIERICFNVGREIYVYDYGGIHNASDLSKPVDKRVYKGTFPTCHDFNQDTATEESTQLIIGFSAGQIQLIDPYQKEFQSRLYNEDRVIDKSAVTCLKWVPGHTSLFIASHASGNLYIYNDEFVCTPNPPVYQLFKQGEGYSIYNCKTKSPRNPIQKWTIGSGAVNQFDFSCRDGKYLATAGQDGFLRVFNYESMELLGYIKGQGHKSWISQVAFDPTSSKIMVFQSLSMEVSVVNSNGHSLKIASRNRISSHITTPPKATYSMEYSHSPSSTKDVFGYGASSSQSPSKEFHSNNCFANCVPSSSGISSTNSLLIRPHKDSFTNTSMAWLAAGEKATATGGTEELHNNSSSIFGKHSGSSKTCYRIGTVSHDTQICLWELPDDILQLNNGSDGASLNKSYQQESHFNNETTPNSTVTSNTNAGFVVSGKKSSGGSKKTSGNNTTVISIGYTNSLGRGDILNKEDSENNTATTSAAYNQIQPSPVTDPAQQSKESKSRLKKLHKRGLSFGSKLTGHDRWSRSNGENSSSLNGLSPNGNSTNSNVLTMRRDDANKIFGTAQCPRLPMVPMIEPLVCKKIAHERLTVLHFREDCLVTACQEGFVCTWARPGKVISQRTNLISMTPSLHLDATTSNNQGDSTPIDGTCV
uniref:WD repeat-containing protein 20 n=1 Tax=Ditylenchus dipsaci TaxID=166011 RepID=A0A915EB46_9BILA